MSERKDDRYPVSLELWKLDSRIRLEIARLSMSPDQNFEPRLRPLMEKRQAARVQLVKMELQRTTERLAKFDEELKTLQSGSDGLVGSEIERLKKMMAARVRLKSSREATSNETAAAPKKTEAFEVEGFSSCKLTHHFGRLTPVRLPPTFGDGFQVSKLPRPIVYRSNELRSAMKSHFGLTLLIVAASTANVLAAGAAKVLPPAVERFSSIDVEEVPDFRRHMVPLLGKLGCNSRACHGSFQGQGGFRLSLFGYDFKMDHEGLADRVDSEDPTGSYAIQKALLEEPHKGGKRFDKNSWEYNLFVRWIAGGAETIDVEKNSAI